MDGAQNLIALARDGVNLLLSPMALFAVAGLWILVKITTALYYISPLHPLYSFPGPRLAAMSYLYEAYYDFWLVGRYTWEISRMHDEYGHIVRINPHELHCDDAILMDEIYAGGNRVRDKWQHFVNTSNAGPVEAGTFSTVPHEIHRRRRRAVERYFSRSQTLKLEHEVHSLAQRVANKLLGMTHRSFNIREAFNCFTADIISQYAFGEEMGFVDQPGTWEPNLATWTADFFSMVFMMRHIAPVRVIARLTYSRTLGKMVGGTLERVIDSMMVELPKYIQNAKEEKTNNRIFTDLVDSPYLPDEDKTVYRLTGEGYTLLTAGTETTSATLTGLTYYLLSQPEKLERLREDLRDLDPQSLDWLTLEQRPYLWACVQEALRLFPGVSHRSARIARDENIVYRRPNEDGDEDEEGCIVIIPKGTPIGMTSTIQHHNEETFPDSWSFVPERWLLDDDDGKRKNPNHALEKQLLTFGRGSRVCLGMQLAMCELYIMVAVMALRVLPRMRLHETTEDDVRYHHDLVVPKPKQGSGGVRVIVS